MAELLASTLILCGLMSSVQPFPYAAAPVAPTVSTAAVPMSLAPFKLNNPYHNNQYYNQNRAGPVIPILSYSSEHVGDGTYSFSFATGDGKQAQENGFLKDAYIDNTGNPQGTQVVQGSFAYVSPEGIPIQVSYVADENGFRPSGVHIPADGKAPVLPLSIIDGKDRLFNPLYNRYNPSNYQNPNNNYNGQYNRYDSRYPNDPTKYNPYFNRYNPSQFLSQNKVVKEETRKEAT